MERLDAPWVFSTLTCDMVPTGRDLTQCPLCKFWMSDKPTPSEEREHDMVCTPQPTTTYMHWREVKEKEVNNG